MLTTHRYINYTPTPGNAQELAPSRARTSEKTPKVSQCDSLQRPAGVNRSWKVVQDRGPIRNQSLFSSPLKGLRWKSGCVWSQRQGVRHKQCVCVCARVTSRLLSPLKKEQPAGRRLWKEPNWSNTRQLQHRCSPQWGIMWPPGAPPTLPGRRSNSETTSSAWEGRCFSTRHLWFRST